MSQTFLFTSEHEALRTGVQALLARHQPEERLRELIETEHAHDAELWALMAGQLGLHGLLVPEEHGGSGASFVELGIVLEEMGAALLAGPFLGTVFALALLDRCAETEKARLLPGIADGSVIATAALSGAAAAHTRARLLPVRATLDANGRWQLDGSETTVLAGGLADLVLLPAQIGKAGDGRAAGVRPDGAAEAEIGIFAVRGDASGLTRTGLKGLDLTRPFAHLSLSAVAAEQLHVPGGAAAVAHALDLASVALVCEQVGAASRLLDMTVDYAKTRFQFGRPIGSFQAIKHRCADLLLDVETARSAAYYAMWAAADDAHDLPVVASLAKAYCADAFTRTAAATIQLHGGIGFTWEHPAHLYYRRAKSSQRFLGSPDQHREQLAERLTDRLAGEVA